MTYQYFTPGDAEQYAYYRIPKMLITDKQFRGISMEAKLLYGILLDRVSLSLKNGWVDENNHVYIIFTIEQIMQEIRSRPKEARNCGMKRISQVNVRPSSALERRKYQKKSLSAQRS